jgi:ribosome-binding protein aMBF1 (putative translation factor)
LPDTRIDEFLELLRDAVHASGKTKAEISVEAGVHPNTLSRMEHEHWAPSIHTIRALERHLLPPKPRKKKSGCPELAVQ